MRGARSRVKSTASPRAKSMQFRRSRFWQSPDPTGCYKGKTRCQPETVSDANAVGNRRHQQHGDKLERSREVVDCAHGGIADGGRKKFGEKRTKACGAA